MVYTSRERQNEVRIALRTIVSDPQFGVRALSNPRAMSNMLKDMLPDAPAETLVLVAAAEAGLAQSLENNVAQGMDLQTAVSLSASAFQARTSFTPEACRWVAAELATALGMAPPGWADPGQVESGIGAAVTAQRSPIGQDWAVPGQRPPAPPTVPSPPAYGVTLPPPPPGRPPSSRVKWVIGGAAAAVVAAAAIVVATLSHHSGPAASPSKSSPPASSSPAIAATEPLARVIAPNVAPQGVQLKNCVPDSKSARKFGLQAFTSSMFCLTNTAHIVFWGFQFDSAAHYQAAVKQLLSYTGFDNLTARGSCPPQAGSKAGTSVWYDKPKYQAKSQTLYCFEDGVFPKYIWTLPQQRVIFFSLNGQRNSSFASLDRFWRTLTWG